MSPNTLQVDIRNDFAVFDNLETVTYYRRIANSQFDAGTVVTGALREQDNRAELQRKGSNVRRTLAWDLPIVQVGSFAVPVAPLGTSDPKVNDVIQDAAGVRWSVLSADLATLQTRAYLQTMQERH